MRDGISPFFCVTKSTACQVTFPCLSFSLQPLTLVAEVATLDYLDLPGEKGRLRVAQTKRAQFLDKVKGLACKDRQEEARHQSPVPGEAQDDPIGP
jgi:hypothetical protein